MNRLAVDTMNEQVSNALSEAQCVMNTTTDGAGGGVVGGVNNGLDDFGVPVQKTGFGSGDNGVLGRGSIGYSNRKAKVNAADLGAESLAGGAPDDFEDDAQEMPYKSFDESQITLVSTLTEETCPGKEVPIVDGAPDAAQNSDRVLWENNKSAAGSAVHRQSTPLVLLTLNSALALAIQYFR